MRLFIWLALMALLAAMVAGCNRIGQSAGNVAKGNSNTPTAGTAPDNVRRVTINELRDDLDKGKAIVIDVRGDAAYNQEHIKGALDIPEAQLVPRAGELPKDKLIVLYCSWPAEHSSARAAQVLQKAGFDNVAALLGGTNAWKSAGFPMESGNK